MPIIIGHFFNRLGLFLIWTVWQNAPPHILPKCPHPQKSRTLQGILLIYDYNGSFFLKTQLKLETFLPQTKRPLPHGLVFLKNQFYTSISDFFFVTKK